MWVANYEDGSSISSKQRHWPELPRDRRMTGVQLIRPASEGTQVALSLSELDCYYFVKEAIAFPGDTKPTILAEVIGGHNLALGIGFELCWEVTGNIRFRHYPVERFKYDRSILFQGKGNNHVAAVRSSL